MNKGNQSIFARSNVAQNQSYVAQKLSVVIHREKVE